LSPPAAARMIFNMLKRTVFEMGLSKSIRVRAESCPVRHGHR
jgi:hypothetical protein